MKGNFQCHTLTPVISVDSVVTIHRFNYSPAFHFTGEKHDFWEFAYVESGPVGSMVEATGYKLRQGEIIFHKPNEYHNIWANGSSAQVVIVSFVSDSPALNFFRGKILTCSETERTLIASLISLSDEVFLPQKNPRKNAALETMNYPLEKRTQQAFGSEQLLKQTLETLLIQFIRSDATVKKETRSSAEMKRQNEQLIAEAILAYIEAHLHEPISLDDVCSALCFSKSYIKRVFKEQTGASIMNTVLNRKLQEAKVLLENLSVTQTADALGFSSIHYFSRLFHQKTGITPTEFQNSRSK